MAEKNAKEFWWKEHGVALRTGLIISSTILSILVATLAISNHQTKVAEETNKAILETNKAILVTNQKLIDMQGQISTNQTTINEFIRGHLREHDSFYKTMSGGGKDNTESNNP